MRDQASAPAPPASAPVITSPGAPRLPDSAPARYRWSLWSRLKSSGSCELFTLVLRLRNRLQLTTRIRTRSRLGKIKDSRASRASEGNPKSDSPHFTHARIRHVAGHRSRLKAENLIAICSRPRGFGHASPDHRVSCDAHNVAGRGMIDQPRRQIDWLFHVVLRRRRETGRRCAKQQPRFERNQLKRNVVKNQVGRWSLPPWTAVIRR